MSADVVRRHLLAHGKDPKAVRESDILPVLVRWARVRGLWAHHGNPAPRGWRISASGGGVLVVLQGASVNDPAFYWTVSPAIALAWALLVETDAGPVDVGRCPACVARSGARKIATHEWRQSLHGAEAGLGGPDGPDTWERASRHLGSRRIYTWSRPCPACNGTGRETIPAARLLLGAASGDEKARERLDVHAECTLRDRGDPIGELLAWALGLWAGEPTQPIWSPNWAAEIVAFGHPHTAAASGALTEAFWERLREPFFAASRAWATGAGIAWEGLRLALEHAEAVPRDGWMLLSMSVDMDGPELSATYARASDNGVTRMDVEARSFRGGKMFLAATPTLSMRE